jgi:hypothetical protein
MPDKSLIAESPVMPFSGAITQTFDNLAIATVIKWITIYDVIKDGHCCSDKRICSKRPSGAKFGAREKWNILTK